MMPYRVRKVSTFPSVAQAVFLSLGAVQVMLVSLVSTSISSGLRLRSGWVHPWISVRVSINQRRSLSPAMQVDNDVYGATRWDDH